MKLHWANHDQYYVKSSEYFRDYTFTAGGKRVHFKLAKADTEKLLSPPSCRAVTDVQFSWPLTFVDGQGRLHPRRAGIACGFAVSTGLGTIGIGKSLLCGRVEPFDRGAESADIVQGGAGIGAALGRGAPS